MGNNTHKNPSIRGGMAITSDKTSYVGGEIVAGYIFLNLEEITNPAIVFFGFKGRERSSFYNEHGKPPHRFQGKNNIANFKFPIYSWDTIVNSDSYSIPFSFKLPEKLPGSIQWEIPDKFGIISYQLRAKVETNDGKKLKASASIEIKQIATAIHHSISYEKYATIKSCCWNKGVIYMKAKLSKDYYTPEEVATLIVDINNSKSRIGLNNIYLTLSRRVRLTGTYTANLGLTHHINSVYSTEVVLEYSADGVPAGISNNPNLITTEESKQILFEIDLRSIKDKLYGHFTTFGTLVECAYMIDVSAVMNGNCLYGDSPILSTSLMLYPAELLPPQLPQPPQNWNPVDIPQINMSWSPQYEVRPSAPELNLKPSTPEKYQA